MSGGWSLPPSLSLSQHLIWRKSCRKAALQKGKTPALKVHRGSLSWGPGGEKSMQARQEPCEGTQKSILFQKTLR